MQLSSCTYATVLMHICNCPHTILYVSLYYRFIQPENLFKDALKILRENEEAPGWLKDKGKDKVDGFDLYVRFQNSVEQGIRNVALSGSRLFKKGDISSRKNWENVDTWRKRRCHTFLARYFLQRPSYKAYYKFKFEDYVERVLLFKTYDVRHLPMSSGTSEEKFTIPDPDCWGTGSPAVPTSSDTGADNTNVSFDTVQSESNPQMQWDSDNDVFVQV